MAYFRVQFLAVASYFALSVLYLDLDSSTEKILIAIPNNFIIFLWAAKNVDEKKAISHIESKTQQALSFY